MRNEDIIKNKLAFLINDYGFDFDYRYNGPYEWLRLSNNYGCICWVFEKIYESYELTIVINGEGRKLLDTSWRNENCVLKIDKKKEFFKNLFKNKKVIYWDQISTIFKSEIERTGTLFGLTL